jgi:hypothetical protein
MAGRILNRQARTKILYNLVAVAEQCLTYDGLAGVMAVAQTALDAGEDVEKVRDACNARRLILKESKQKERYSRELFSNKTADNLARG